jgi:hypothetical protein
MKVSVTGSQMEYTDNSLINDNKGTATDITMTENRKFLQKYTVDIPKETLDLFEDPDVCTICYSDKIEENNKAQFSCGHKSCRLCVINHLNININNGKVNKYLYNIN